MRVHSCLYTCTRTHSSTNKTEKNLNKINGLYQSHCLHYNAPSHLYRLSELWDLMGYPCDLARSFLTNACEPIIISIKFQLKKNLQVRAGRIASMTLPAGDSLPFVSFRPLTSPGMLRHFFSLASESCIVTRDVPPTGPSWL